MTAQPNPKSKIQNSKFREENCIAMRIEVRRGVAVAPLLLLSALFVWVSPASAGPQPAPQTAPPPAIAPPADPFAPKIAEIVVVGNKAFNSVAIIAFSGHKVGEPLTPAVLDEMKTNIFNTGYFGYNEGYSPESVKVSAETRNADKQIKVVIEVDENPKISDILVTGSGPIPDTEIKKMIRNTTVYNVAQFRRDTQDIEDRYAKAGYLAAISADSGPDAVNPSALNVSLIVVRLTEIKLVKNVKTKSKTILREMKLKVGDYYNRETLRKDVSRLYNLNLFDEVIPTERDLNSPGKIGLTLSLPERRSGQVLAGVGFSNRQQLIGFAQVGETNFRGLAESVNLRWESGGVTGHSTVEAGYFEPWIDRRHTSMNISAYDRINVRFANTLSNSVSSTDNVGTDTRYYEERVGTTITLARPFRDTYLASASLRAENVRTNNLALSTTNSAILQDGPIGVLSGGLSHDSRDVVFDPVTGSYQSGNLSVGYADIRPVTGVDISQVPAGIFGKTTFAKSQLEFRQFFSPTGPRKRLDQDKSTVAMRLILGTSAGTLPFFEQFFVGGTETLRGYREDRFWGRNLFFGSVEFRQPLARSLKGVLFADVGSAWGGAYQNVQISGFSQGGFRPHFGVGAGIRFRTPIGPLRLDYGIGDEGGRTHFSIGNVF